MIDPTRTSRGRRANRRPGWLLLTALLVLAIVASSALVFTDQVELLKLAVVIALWAAVAAAFASFVYRRQADLDQARARDLKLVYDLQLDREISARREYELSLESHLRRELASELRAQSADEVAALRAELAALRANLEFYFDADLAHRPALETDRSGQAVPVGRVVASRIDTEDRPDLISEPNTEESPIIDVAAEPHVPPDPWAPPPPPPQPPFGGAHRLTPPPAPSDWQPSPAEGQWIPAGQPGSNWAPAAPEPAQPPVQPPVPPVQDRGPEPTMTLPVVPPVPTFTPEPTPVPMPEPAPQPPRRGRHGAAEEPAQPETPVTSGRRRRAEPDDEPAGQHVGGQPAAELLARLQANTSGGGRRRRRED
ncbi:DUF6779 domain-containing protein [Mycolicibacterium llatzerense]|uniref:DUF6779 domain-containing protein n=1 Tax=Mycolicibacterium llatzerense TaxID=280871 RepID=UPI0005BB0142|nr:DUF6779 domain-containing protein [Mycolicibacterium llatzerense]MCT7369251.1 hypothetical protein [Mycolicibacterium llatzerense]